VTAVGEITLRPRREDDLEFLARLYGSTRTDEMALVDWPPAEKETFLAMQFDVQTRYYDEHYADADFSVIERGGEPIGRIYLQSRDDEIRIVDIALLPEHRGSGIGGRLLRRVLDEAAASGKAVRIHVERNNPALRLYRRLGFRRIDDLGVYVLMEWTADEP